MTTPDDDAAIVAGGYLLVHRGDVPDVDGFLSASECIACQFPGAWAPSWVDVDLDERRALLSHWGVDPDSVDRFISATDAAFEADTIAWPSVFRSPRAARRFARAQGVAHPTLTLIGIGLARQNLDVFLDAVVDETEGFADTIARCRPLAGGHEAGWEVLGDDGGAFHSWHCHPDLAEEMIARGRFAPNGLGLLTSEQDAEWVAEAYDSDAGTESVRWLPWLIRTYAL